MDNDGFYTGEQYPSHSRGRDDISSRYLFEKRKNSLDELTTKIEILEEEVERQRSKNLEILAVFGALFTFISIQLQQLADSNKVIAVFIGLLSLGGLLLFSSLLVLASSFSDWRKILISSLCLLAAILIIIFGWGQFSSYMHKQDYCTFLTERRNLSKDAKAKEQIQARLNTNCNP